MRLCCCVRINVSSILFLVVCCLVLFFFFKQKTAYEMRISDWSSDVCSSDLQRQVAFRAQRLEIADLEALDKDRRGAAAIAILIEDREQRRLEIGRASCRERVCQYV